MAVKRITKTFAFGDFPTGTVFIPLGSLDGNSVSIELFASGLDQPIDVQVIESNLKIGSFWADVGTTLGTTDLTGTADIFLTESDVHNGLNVGIKVTAVTGPSVGQLIVSIVSK